MGGLGLLGAVLAGPVLALVVVALGGAGVFVYVNRRDEAGARDRSTAVTAKAKKPPRPPSPRALAKAARLRFRREGLFLPIDQEMAVARAVSALGAHHAVVNSVTTNTITGMVVTKKRPSILLALFLFWLCFIPAVIYMITGSKETTETFALRFDAVDGGTRIVPTGQGTALDAALDAMMALSALA